VDQKTGVEFLQQLAVCLFLEKDNEIANAIKEIFLDFDTSCFGGAKGITVVGVVIISESRVVFANNGNCRSFCKFNRDNEVIFLLNSLIVKDPKSWKCVYKCLRWKRRSKKNY
jgi:hypothetical protein